MRIVIKIILTSIYIHFTKAKCFYFHADFDSYSYSVRRVKNLVLLIVTILMTLSSQTGGEKIRDADTWPKIAQ